MAALLEAIQQRCKTSAKTRLTTGTEREQDENATLPSIRKETTQSMPCAIVSSAWTADWHVRCCCIAIAAAAALHAIQRDRRAWSARPEWRGLQRLLLGVRSSKLRGDEGLQQASRIYG